jgi:hypothetical protein
MATFPNFVGATLYDTNEQVIGTVEDQTVEDDKLWLNVDGDFEIAFSEIRTHNGTPDAAATIAYTKFSSTGRIGG